MMEFAMYNEKYILPISMEGKRMLDIYLIQKTLTIDKKNQDSLRSNYVRERADLIHKQRINFLNYTKQHPNSYVALWQLVREMNDGYQPIFDTIYSLLSSKLKYEYTGKILGKRLISSKVTAIGQPFPTLTLIDIEKKLTILPELSAKNIKYTLVDFWFSRCTPCLQEFPKIKELYNVYKQAGFDVIGISIDKKSDISTWQKTIKEKDLNWSQYLDQDGKITTDQLSVRYFPSNFLLDEEGTIVKKNISPSDLQNFLANNLKKD